MKNNTLLITALLSATSSISVFAADGQINFSGSVIDETCQVVNTPSSPLNVNLGNVSRSAFRGPGSLAAATKFTVRLIDCPARARVASIKFDGMPLDGDFSVLALTPGVDTAKGVGIQLSDASNTVVSLGTETKGEAVTPSGGHDFQFVARYIQKQGQVETGIANAVASFTVVYN